MSEQQTPDSPQWLLHLLQSVYDMRIAQKDYFSHRCDSNLRISKHKESVVDNIIDDAVKKGYVRERVKNTIKPKELF